MYTFDGRIRYSEVDRSRKLTAEKMIDYFQDSTSFQSEDLGIGLDYMTERGIAWVINYWQIHFYRRPVMGEAVRIGTQPYEFKGLMGLRNFMMETLEGDKSHMTYLSILAWMITLYKMSGGGEEYDRTLLRLVRFCS